MDYRFHVGDRVTLTEAHYLYDFLSVRTGRVCTVEHADVDGYVGVEFDESHEVMHTCEGHAKRDHGYYVKETDLTLCAEEDEEIDPPAGIFDIL